uniref:Uncharacterized protein n=1 Tax=Anguilla anguilla TaxID=7936 RepID=A0A0E9W6D9_ANGAN
MTTFQVSILFKLVSGCNYGKCINVGLENPAHTREHFAVSLGNTNP